MLAGIELLNTQMQLSGHVQKSISLEPNFEFEQSLIGPDTC